MIIVTQYKIYVIQSMKSVSSRRRQQRKQQTPGDVESDESESDPDQLTSSRTESSNQLDAGKLKHSMPNYSFYCFNFFDQ